MTSYAGYLLETLLTLAVVCAAAFGVLYGARRLGVGRATGPVTLAGHLPLDGRRAIYLVRVGAQVFVVGASEAGLTKLGEIPASDVPPRAAEPESPFAKAMARAFARSAASSSSSSSSSSSGGSSSASGSSPSAAAEAPQPPSGATS
jgi:flagellar protein FliO/FliZ